MRVWNRGVVRSPLGKGSPDSVAPGGRLVLLGVLLTADELAQLDAVYGPVHQDYRVSEHDGELGDLLAACFRNRLRDLLEAGRQRLHVDQLVKDGAIEVGGPGAEIWTELGRIAEAERQPHGGEG